MWAGYRSARVLARPPSMVDRVVNRRYIRASQQSSEHRMRSLVALLLASACALARPPGPEPSLPPAPRLVSPYRRPAPQPSPKEIFGDFIYTRFILPHIGYDDERRAPPDRDWLSKEIDRINQMQEEEDSPTTYDMDIGRWIAGDSYIPGMFDNARMREMPYESRIPEQMNTNEQLLSPKALISPETQPVYTESKEIQDKRESNNTSKHRDVNFALTPLDEGYFDGDTDSEQPSPLPNQEYAMHEGDPQTAMLLEPPRQIRQNPLSKSKTLVAENLERLRTGLSHDEGHSTDRPRHVHVLETVNDPAESIYGVALLAAIGATLTMAVFGLAIGWYTLFKKAKAAADVDYPAYGVTGPTIDTSGDRKLAHSAHMYHYQHQKQQIIAMERNGMEQRSISDPESEEENEEGDYTVYECPGFATTGDMEVKNPLFSEEPTPATPGKCEVVKPQPKD